MKQTVRTGLFLLAGMALLTSAQITRGAGYVCPDGVTYLDQGPPWSQPKTVNGKAIAAAQMLSEDDGTVDMMPKTNTAPPHTNAPAPPPAWTDPIGTDPNAPHTGLQGADFALHVALMPLFSPPLQPSNFKPQDCTVNDLGLDYSLNPTNTLHWDLNHVIYWDYYYYLTNDYVGDVDFQVAMTNSTTMPVPHWIAAFNVEADFGDGSVSNAVGYLQLQANAKLWVWLFDCIMYDAGDGYPRNELVVSPTYGSTPVYDPQLVPEEWLHKPIEFDVGKPLNWQEIFGLPTKTETVSDMQKLLMGLNPTWTEQAMVFSFGGYSTNTFKIAHSTNLTTWTTMTNYTATSYGGGYVLVTNAPGAHFFKATP